MYVYMYVCNSLNNVYTMVLYCDVTQDKDFT